MFSLEGFWVRPDWLCSYYRSDLGCSHRHLNCSNPFETDVEEMIDFVRTSQEINLRKARLSELSSPARHRSAAVR